MSTRAREIHQARVYLSMSRAFRVRDPAKPKAGLWLLQWAANARRRAAALPPASRQFRLDLENLGTAA